MAANSLAAKIAEDFLSCSICFLQLGTNTQMCSKCSKMFHRMCLQTWFQQSHSCPTCRQELRNQDLVNVGWMEDLAGEFQRLPNSSDDIEDSATLSVVSNSAAVDGKWKSLNRRVNCIETETGWIVALLRLPDYTLCIANNGYMAAISSEFNVLWRTSIKREGLALVTFVWHAAYDELRHRILFCFHNVADFLVKRPVDIYWASVEDLEQNAGSSKLLQTQLLYSNKNWRCLGLAVESKNDLLFCTDWASDKIGVWKLSDLEDNSSIEAKHVIYKPDGVKKFHPTRCAVLHNSSDNSISLAVSDWRNSRIFMFSISIENVRGTATSILSQHDTVLASKGDQFGEVCGPVDLHFDKATANLVVCDQWNKRLTVFVAAPKLPHISAVLTESVRHRFSAVTVIEVTVGTEVVKYVLVGLDNGEIHYFRVET